MKNTLFWGLLGLNALLLGLFLSHYVRDNAAQAQVAGAAGGPGEYIICPGSITGIASEVVYVVDTLNGRLGAVVYDNNRNGLDTMPATDLNRVYQAAAAPQTPTTPGVPGAVGPGTMRR